MANRPNCPKHGDPLICLACESDEDRIWMERGYITTRTPQRSVSAASQPAQTCATCKHFTEHGTQECTGSAFEHLRTGDCAADEVIQLNSRGVIVYRGFGCTLHEPAPPVPGVQEKSK